VPATEGWGGDKGGPATEGAGRTGWDAQGA